MFRLPPPVSRAPPIISVEQNSHISIPLFGCCSASIAVCHVIYGLEAAPFILWLPVACCLLHVTLYTCVAYCLLAFACQAYVNKIFSYLNHLQDEWNSGNVSSGVHLAMIVIKTMLRGREVVVGTCSSHGADPQWLELHRGIVIASRALDLWATPPKTRADMVRIEASVCGWAGLICLWIINVINIINIILVDSQL